MLSINIRVILTCLLASTLANCEAIPAKNHQSRTKQDTARSEASKGKENSYAQLRNMALSVTPEQLGLSLPSDKDIVYGVVMDWAMDDVVATIVAYSTGDASLYLSSGGGVIGGGQHERVSAAAQRMVGLAQTMLKKSRKTEAMPLPRRDVVKFYLLTNHGIFVGEEEMKNFENNSSIWLKLFSEGNNVLAELRETSER